MITGGKHNCIVLPTANGWFAESGAKNTPSIRLNLRVTDGDSEGEEIEWHGWLTEKAAGSTVDTLKKVFGWNGDLESLAQQINTGPFAGRHCRIVTEMEEYEGKKKVKIKWLNSAGTPGVSPEKAMGIARRLMGKTPVPATRPTPPPDPNLDVKPGDIPF